MVGNFERGLRVLAAVRQHLLLVLRTQPRSYARACGNFSKAKRGSLVMT
jgi:hypothetical protein